MMDFCAQNCSLIGQFSPNLANEIALLQNMTLLHLQQNKRWKRDAPIHISKLKEPNRKKITRKPRPVAKKRVIKKKRKMIEEKKDYIGQPKQKSTR